MGFAHGRSGFTGEYFARPLRLASQCQGKAGLNDAERPGAAGCITGQNRALAVAVGCAVPELAVRALGLACDECATSQDL